MKLFIKNKFITIDGSSYAINENNKNVFKVKGKWFSLTKKKKIYDMDGELLFVVRNKFWHFINNSCLIYNGDKELVVKITDKGFDFRNSFIVQGIKDEIIFSGNLFQFPNIKMEISKNGEKIGTLIKEFNMFRDTFTLDVDSEEDAGLFVALTIAIDNIFDAKSKKK